MRNYLNIVRMQLYSMLRMDKTDGKTNRKWVAAAVGLSVLYGIIMFALIVLIWAFSASFFAMQLQSEFVTFLLMIALSVVLIFGIVTVLTCLYFSKDTEFFLALPIKPSTVFAGKLTVVYLIEFVVTTLFLLPCLIATGILMHASWVFYATIPFALVLTPAVPLFLASIIAIPVMFVVSALKGKGAVGSVLVLLLFGAFFVLYYWGVSRMQNIDPEHIDLSGMQQMFRKLASTVYPLYALARAMTATGCWNLSVSVSVLLNLLIGVGSIVALGAIALFISAIVYRKGAAGQLESTGRKNETKTVYRASGAVKAIMKREWREILRTPAFALNCLLGIIMCPIVVAFIGFTSSTSEIAAESGLQTQQQIDIAVTVMRYVMFFIVMFMSVGTNGAAPTAFSREGDKFYYTKLIPMDYKAQVRAKSYVYLIIGAISSVFGAVVTAIMNFDLIFFLCSLVFLLCYNFFFVHFGILLDVCRPKLRWTTPNEAVKHNRNVVITVFGGMFAALVLAAGGAALYFALASVMAETAAALVSWFILLVIVLAAAIITYCMLYKICAKKLEAIEA